MTFCCCAILLQSPALVIVGSQFMMGGGILGRGVNIGLFVMDKRVTDLSIWFGYFCGVECYARVYS